MRRLLVLIALLLTSAGCCETDPDDDAISNRPIDNPDMDVVDPVEVDNTGQQYAAEYVTRVDQLVFAGAPVADLNGLVAVNLSLALDEPIIVVHRLTDIDETAGTATFETGPAVKTANPDEFAYDSRTNPQSAAATLDPASGQFESTLSRFSFVATIEFGGDVQRVNIPVSDMTVTGTLELADDGATASIPAGTWDGHITRTDGDATLVRLQAGQPERPLTDLFSEQSLNYDTSTGEDVAAGTGDAWIVRGTYSAVPITLIP